jgi:hypothetical protein
MAELVEHTYRYPFSSRFIESADSSLQLATSLSGDTFPQFFRGRVLQPRTTALLLNSVARVVSTRYYTPPNVVRTLSQRDPVVTAGAGLLRFEGFSICCSTFARVDLSPDAYDGQLVGHGTTNVDFNPPMRAALARVRDADRFTMMVGPDKFAVRRGFEQIVERKVELPLRWLKGFVEVQAYQSEMELRYTIDKVETLRFLRSLPRSPNHTASFYVVPIGKGLRLSQNKCREAVPLSGVHRLQLLAELAPLADSLKIYCHPSGQASEWQLQCGPLTIQLTITAESSRGFSGEGQVLADLVSGNTDQIAKLRAALKWQSLVNISELAHQVEMNEDEVRKGLALLGTRGIVGFDVMNGAYFHREMPFDLSLIEQMHPRLKAARRLVRESKVEILSYKNEIMELHVAGSKVQHVVTIKGEQHSCTCQWEAKHQGARGPCKHILAARIFSSTAGDDDF